MTGAEIRVSTWNVLLSNSKKGIAGGIQELTDSSDVFGLQEMGSSADRATALRAATAAGPAATMGRSTRPTGAVLCRARTRTRSASRMGLRGWSLSGLSFRGTPPTKRWP